LYEKVHELARIKLSYTLQPKLD